MFYLAPAQITVCDVSARLKTQEHGDRGIDVLTGVVEGERRADRALNSHAAQDGLSTVVAGSHCNALLVERDSNMLSAIVVQNERHHVGKKLVA
jgi:hypothetical protein